jgi:hypothetical protein
MRIYDDKTDKWVIVKDKRFLLFTYLDYYPSGGMSDLMESFDTIDECKQYISKQENLLMDNYDIYDRVQGMEVDL